MYAAMLLLGLSIPAFSCYGQSQLPNWVLGKWEYDKNEVIEFTPTGFIYTVNGKVADEGSLDVNGDFIYPEGKSGVCQDGFVMMKEKLYVEGGDNVPLKKLSGKTSNNATKLSKEYEWLKGVWAGTDEYGNFGRLIVTDSYIQVVNSNMDDESDNVEDMEKQDIELKMRQNDYDGYDDDGKVFGFSDYIGVDVKKHCIYIIQGEYNAVTLHKINANSFESAVYEANHQYPQRSN